MADETLATIPTVVAPVAPVLTPTPIPEPVVAPLAAPVAAIPEVTPTLPPTPVEPPVAAPVAAAEPPAVKVDTGAPTLLAEPLKPVEPTPEPVVNKVDVNDPTKSLQPQAITEGGQSDEPAPPPKYEPFKLPENLPLDEGRITEFTTLLAEAELAKGDHTKMQEFGQKMVDFHVNEVKNTLDTYNNHMIEAFEKQKNDWKENFLKDPEIGGNRWQTTINSALGFINTHGGTPDQQAEIRSLMDSSGLGNHPAIIRLLANAMTAMAEPKPLASVKPIPQVKSRTQTMYGQT